ncbi:hypothetical protein DOTSEDRAFT_180689 [Dothistroma septosporum NZE10]|uniref:Uncharacterized protein n=1 Tax=Dothistroma septosporum (strain NZE10 / CBS 128990) TaxID=675120 RepID=M2WII4_DOTSN|nr:hypothetical protein DOTSEDRAFT_180689 [Dothistroma septosporum NZE10]
MPHENRIEQLEDLKNIETNADLYEKLASGKIATTQSDASSLSKVGGTAQPYYVPVPITIKSQLGSPTALAIGAFATTLTTLSLALMGFRGVGVTNAFIGDFFGVAGIGMFVSANWELVLGNTYAYTVLAAFGLFYAGFGFILTPFFGVAESYGGADTPEYYNAVGFFVLMWAVWNLFFLLGSLPLNLVYIGIFFTVQMAFTLVAAAYFCFADGKMETGKAVQTAGGAFAFASGMLGYYTVANLMCQEAMRFSFPMGDTSRFFKRKSKQL